jgi:hypothetical protein
VASTARFGVDIGGSGSASASRRFRSRRADPTASALPHICRRRDHVRRVTPSMSRVGVERKPASSLPSRENFDASSEESDRHLNNYNYL